MIPIANLGCCHPEDPARLDREVKNILIPGNVISMIRRCALLALPCCLAACASHYASQERGSDAHDPLVTAFHADRETAWLRFRLGDGLNVVVDAPGLPREFAWRVQTGGISSSPTVMGSTVLVSANDDHLYAIDAATGALRWRYRAENEIMSQPAYAHGLIFIGTGNSSHRVFDPPHLIVTGEGINKLEAIDERTGIEQWNTGLAGTGMPSQAIVNGDVISVDGGGVVLAVDAQTGAFRWDQRLPSAFAMSSVVDGENGLIYVSGHLQNAVYALRANDGAVLWKHTFSTLYGAIGTNPLAIDGNVLIGLYLQPLSRGPFGPFVTENSRALQHMYALDARTGALLWDTAMTSVHGRSPRYNESAIELIYGNRIYVGSALAPIVSALDMHGHVLWQTRVSGPVKGGICARDGVLYLGDHKGILWALDAGSGRVIGSMQTDMHFNTGSPIIVNDTLVEGGTSDVLAVPLAAIRDSREVAGVSRLTAWERLGRFLGALIPRRDPHLEAAGAGTLR